MSATTASWPLTIYYDAACPLCAAEMHAIKANDRDGALRLVDCSPPDFLDPDAAAAGVERAALLRRIHACDAQGRWFVGVDVFVLAYRVAGLGLAARMWEHPRWRPFWDRLYPWVADHRYLLSRLGIARAYGLLLRVLARRARQRAAACADGVCGATVRRQR